MKTEQIQSNIVWKLLLYIQKAIIVLSSLTIVVIMSLWAILRYVFHADMYGMEEIVVMVAFWLYFMGSSYAVCDKSHVKADIIPSLLSKRHQNYLKPVLYALMCVASLVYTMWSFDTVHYSYIENPKTLALRIPFWIGQSSIFVGFLLCSMYSAVYCIQSLIVAVMTWKNPDYMLDTSVDFDEDSFVL